MCGEGGEGVVVNLKYKDEIRARADEVLALLEGYGLTADQKIAIIRMARQKLIDMNRTEGIESIKSKINY